MSKSFCKPVLFGLLIFGFVTARPASAQAQTPPAASLRGSVSDPSGARIPDALVQIAGPGGEQRKTTDSSGVFNFPALTPGNYIVRIIAKGFTLDERVDFAISGPVVLDVQLKIEVEGQVVNVEAEANKLTVSLDPDSNASALVIGKDELNNLSDDPDELAQQLQALAGPGAGPQGGQVYTDGFAGSPPPKSSIREIRINSNPFSSEYDQPGFSRIEILTKPGGDTFHGQLSNQYNNQSLNSRSALYVPSAPGKSSLPAYKNLLWNGSLTGPLKKDRASFTFDFNRRDITENAFILATNLDSNFNPQVINEGVITPQRFMSFAPRFDVALNATNTLILRYQDNRNRFENLGVGNTTLPQAAYNQRTSERTLQVTETSLLSPLLVNEMRFQFSRSTRQFFGGGSAAALVVQDAFTAGSARVGNSSNITRRWELNNLSILSHGAHTIKWGGRVRQSFNDDASLNNFNGTFTFFGGSGPVLDANDQPVGGTSVSLTGLQVYQRTLAMQQRGFTAAQIRAAGGGASLFSLNAGVPLEHVEQLDLGVFVNDDWKVRPNLTLSTGLRYERQTNIRRNNAWAPRLGVAWGIDGKGATPAKTVLRGGAGLFYNRITDNVTLNALRYNGVTQQSFLVANPDFFPVVPDLSTLAGSVQPQTIQLVSDTLQAATFYAMNVGMDRQIDKSMRVSVNYYDGRFLHMQRSRDVNARMPGTNTFPYGDSTVRMQTESSASMSIRTLQVNPTISYRKISLFGFFGVFWQKNDFEGLAANPYDLRSEWGPGSGDVRYRANFGPTFPLLWKVTVNSSVFYASAAPYNITTGLPDPSGDGAAVQRPALVNLPVASCNGGTLKYVAEFGCFDLSPAPGTPAISRNYGRGPSAINGLLRIARTWSFGQKESAGGAPRMAPAPGGPPMPPPAPGASGAMKYNVTLSVSAVNPLNHPNFSNPNGNLSSPFFGRSQTLQGFPFGPTSTYNRKVTLQIQLSF